MDDLHLIIMGLYLLGMGLFLIEEKVVEFLSECSEKYKDSDLSFKVGLYGGFIFSLATWPVWWVVFEAIMWHGRYKYWRNKK